jgi:hypothetical protein
LSKEGQSFSGSFKPRSWEIYEGLCLLRFLDLFLLELLGLSVRLSTWIGLGLGEGFTLGTNTACFLSVEECSGLAATLSGGGFTLPRFTWDFYFSLISQIFSS